MLDELRNLDDMTQTILEIALLYGPKIVLAILVFILGIFIAKASGRAVHRGLSRFELEPPLRQLLVRTVSVLVIGVFITIALQNLGVELLPLIAGLGIAGAGIALAMQGVLGNVVAGLTIIFTKPYRVGDYVSLAGEEGEVKRIELSSTTLIHPDLSEVVVPNRKIAGEILHNYGRIRQIDVAIGAGRDTDLDAALASAHAVVRANALCLQTPAPVVAVGAIGDGGVTIIVRPWVRTSDYGPVAGQIRKAVFEAFRAAEIPAPRPAHDIRMQGRLKVAELKAQ